MTEVLALRRRPAGPRRRAAAKTDPFSGVRHTITDAFKKIGAPLDGADQVTVSQEQAGIRVEVTKTVSALSHKAMLKLIGSIRFRSLKLSRFRIAAVTHGGKPCFRFSFYIQGLRRGPLVIEAAAKPNLIHDIRVAADFVRQTIQAEAPTMPVAVPRIHSYFQRIEAAASPEAKALVVALRARLKAENIKCRVNLSPEPRPQNLRVVSPSYTETFPADVQKKILRIAKAAGFTLVRNLPIDPNQATFPNQIDLYFVHKKVDVQRIEAHVVEAASVPPLSELKATYRLSQFSFYLTHRTKPAVRRTIMAYTRDHAVAELKKKGEWPRGYGIASASGKAARKTEASTVTAAPARATYLKLEKPDPADLTKLKESLGSYKDKEFPRYPKVRQIVAGSLANRVLVAFGRNMTKSQILAISKIIAEQGWYASADIGLEGILREGKGWNGADQVTVFKGRHVARITAAVEAAVPGERQRLAREMIALKKEYRQNPTPALERRMAALKKQQEAVDRESASPMQNAMHDYDVEQMRRRQTESGANLVEAAGRKMSDANLRKRVSDLQWEVKKNKDLIKHLDARKPGTAEQRAAMKKILQEALDKDEAELEKRLADARERGLRNGSLVNNRKL